METFLIEQIDKPLNLESGLHERRLNALIPWSGPLLLLIARSALLILSQGLVALILGAFHSPEPWHAAGKWWTVYGTLAGC